MSTFPILYVADVERSAAQEVSPPANQPWGERLAYFDDPNGHRLHVTMPL